MATQLLVSLLIGALVVVWMKNYKSFPRLVRNLLGMSPFLPLASLLNHNLDLDRWGTAEIFVLLHIGFPTVLSPGSLDPAWAHILNPAFGDTKIPALPTTW